jgi:hypothetical protein
MIYVQSCLSDFPGVSPLALVRFMVESPRPSLAGQGLCLTLNRLVGERHLG